MPAYDKHQHRVRIIGRSKTEDLVDASVDAVKTAWDFGDNTIGQAARVVCDPYGIGVSLPDGDAELPGVAQHMPVYPGYSAYALLEELTRSVGMLLWDNANGDLVISKGGTGGRAGSAIVEVRMPSASRRCSRPISALRATSCSARVRIKFPATSARPPSSTTRRRRSCAAASR
jgi:prophage tail gpP-like protein